LFEGKGGEGRGTRKYKGLFKGCCSINQVGSLGVGTHLTNATSASEAVDLKGLLGEVRLWRRMVSFLKFTIY